MAGFHYFPVFVATETGRELGLVTRRLDSTQVVHYRALDKPKRLIVIVSRLDAGGPRQIEMNGFIFHSQTTM